MLLLTRNLKLHGLHKFRDQFVGPFVITEHIGEMAYWFDLLLHDALRGIQNDFHMSLLHDWQSNGVHADVPSTEIDREAEYKVGETKGYHVRNGEVQYLMLFAGFDSSEDTWLTEFQLEHADELL